MRAVVWVVLLFVVAVVAATTLGTNDGLVSVAWGGWRADLSLNLFILLVLGVCFLIMGSTRAIDSLLTLPTRAAEWRALQRESAPCAKPIWSSTRPATCVRSGPPSACWALRAPGPPFPRPTNSASWPC
jgi:hypothetical protein